MHEFRGICVGDLSRSDERAVTQNGNAICDRENLVESVADVDNADAASLEAADDVEKPRDVALSQRRCRLVHDEDARVVRQGPQDFDPLAVADRQSTDNLVGREIVDFQRGEQLVGFGAHRPPVDSTRPGERRMAKKNVFGDTEFGKQQQLLIDRRYAGAARIVRAGETNLTSVDQNRAKIRLIDPGNDLDER